MKKQFTAFMLTCLFSFIPLLGTWGCSANDEFAETSATSTQDDIAQSSILLAPEGVIYHEETKSWISPRKDPYTLENFQNAYDNLISGKSSKELSSASMQDIATKFKSVTLTSTHFNVKIFPKTEEEQRKIELMDDVTVSYFPFDYVQLPESETTRLEKTGAKTTLAEEGRYTVTYDDYETIDGPVDPFTITLPVLYTIWPCDKPFLPGMDYEILYKVFLPEYSQIAKTVGLKSEAMEALEKEAINLSSDIQTLQRNAARKWEASTPIGYVYHKDEFLRERLPFVDLKIRFQLGSKTWETFTRYDGFYGINVTVPADASFSFVFERYKWKITYKGKTSPIVTTWGSHYNTHPEPFQNVWVPWSSHPEYETHRALEYFYRGQNFVPAYYYEQGIRVEVAGFEDPTAQGRFYYSKRRNPHIVIYNYNREDHNYLLSTVFHELGHFSHYGLKGGYGSFNHAQKFLKESWASYSGWILADKYYTSLGYKIPYQGYSVGTDRQNWYSKIIKPHDTYTPLFIDLIDDFNQFYRYNNWDYPYDVIKNVPYFVIRRITEKATNWADCYKYLQEYIDVYYTSSELRDLVYPYINYFMSN